MDELSIRSATKLRRRKAARAGQGFTLVEVLVVIVIISVFATMTTLGFEAVFGRDAQQETQRLRKVLELASERASIQGKPVRVEFLPHGYRFSTYDTNNEWRLLFEPREFSERSWPDGLGLQRLEIGGQAVTAPYVLQFGSEPPEFRLRLQQNDSVVELVGDITGAIDITPLATLAATAAAAR